MIFSNLFYWIAAVMMFGIVITLHELGHFWAARATGVDVLEFAVGIGPKIYARKAKSGVLYTLRILPFGGFCRFVGDDEAEQSGELTPYFEEKLWKRAAVSIGGPFMNYLAAFLILVALFSSIGVWAVDQSIGEVMPGSAAEEAGFAVGDYILRVNGEDVSGTAAISERIQNAGDAEVVFEVRRAEETVTLRATPRWSEDEGQRMVGIVYGNGLHTFGLFDSMRISLLNIGDMSRMIVDLLRDAIFKGEGTQNLSGPVGTIVQVKEVTQEGGMSTYLFLASLISVNLGLFNLLPIPGLDGSKLIFLLIEKIRGKRIDPNKEGFVMLIGFGLLAVLMVVVLYQDIARLIGA